jgi:EthD domain
MEKVIAVLMRADSEEPWCARQRGPVADALLDLGVPGLSINVRDDAVRQSLMTLTTLDPPVAAVVSLWTQQCYGDQMAAALDVLAGECEQLAAYLVTESVPLPPPSVEFGYRTTGLANIALLRRPAALDQATWLTRWQRNHTRVAIETQSTFGYTQNWVVRALTPDAPGIAGIVEELFPDEAITDLKAFFGAADDNDLQDRVSRMVASTTAFGANENIDTVPTSRYVFATPFTEVRISDDDIA